MAKMVKEYIDKDHRVMDTYYDLCERRNKRHDKSMKKQLKQLIEQDPDFFDSYLTLREIVESEGNAVEAETLLDEAFNRALRLITDKKGNWPDVLEWGWVENRHIIRTILNKAISQWEHNDRDGALDLLRKLLKTNHNDNVGARDFLS